MRPSPCSPLCRAPDVRSNTTTANRSKQAGEKKTKLKKVKQTTRVVVEDESQEGKKKRKRGASPGPAKKGKPGNSPAKKGKPQGKRPRNEQAETGVRQHHSQ